MVDAGAGASTAWPTPSATSPAWAPWPSTARSSRPAARRRSSSRTRPARSAPPQLRRRARRRRSPARSASSRSSPRTRSSAVGSPITVITDDGAHDGDGLRRVHVRRAVVPRRLDAHRHDARRRAALVRHGRAASPRSTSKAEAGRLARDAGRRASAPRCPTDAEVKTGEQAAADQTKQISDAIGAFLTPVLLALRRHRRARRRLHHLQRLLDHRRPAAARVRHAARPRRLAPPGAAEHHRRGARHGRPRLRCSASSPASASPPASTALQGGRRRHPAQRPGARSRARSSSPWPSASASRCSRRWSRRCARRACRRGRPAGGRRAAAVPLRALHAVVAVAVAVLGALLHRRRHVRAGRHDAAAAAPSPSAPCSSSSPSPWSASTSSARSPASSAGRCRSSRRSAAAWRATTAAATRAARPPRPPALMIGLGVVVFVAVFAQGLKSSFVDSFDQHGARRLRRRGQELHDRCPRTRSARCRRVPASRPPPALDAQQVQVDGTRRCRRSTASTRRLRAGLAASTGSSGSDALLHELGHGRGASSRSRRRRRSGVKRGRDASR